MAKRDDIRSSSTSLISARNTSAVRSMKSHAAGTLKRIRWHVKSRVAVVPTSCPNLATSSDASSTMELPNMHARTYGLYKHTHTHKKRKDEKQRGEKEEENVRKRGGGKKKKQTKKKEGGGWV